MFSLARLSITTLLLVGCSASTAAADTAIAKPPKALRSSVELVKIHRGLSKPVALECFTGDPLQRLFVVEQTGKILAIEKGVVSSDAFLDLSDRISTAHTEQGLLGLAFHPKFKSNGRLFVNYTNEQGATEVVEYKATGKHKSVVDLKSRRELLQVEQPWRNHNGGGIEFGPDGHLYVGMGDGGAAADPKRAGQDPNNMLGKMLRLRVDEKQVTPEIVQSGLRNPWRFSFDRKTGDLYIADVGQDKWEEVHVVSPEEIEGANFGWSVMEGKHCFRRSKKKCREGKSFIEPVVEYNHTTGCSITGGHVYRGKELPQLHGAYFYSDFCTAIVRSFRWSGGQVSDHWDWKKTLDPRFRLAQISSFAEDADGELYLLSTDGVIYKLQARKPS